MLGGSFNPPHLGHVHNSEVAMKYLGLDAVWWLVTPGNPLKSKVGLPNVIDRMNSCRQLVQNPRIIISDLESNLGTTRTVETLPLIQKNFPSTEFVWLAGTEIAHEFHKWYRWQDLIRMIPFAFVGRPTQYGVVRNTVFHNDSSLSHHVLHHGGRPILDKGHIYWIFSEPLNPQSSTLLRAQKTRFAPEPSKV
ncbi:MAG TPA: nicotinate-nucleotide adenylyltransferase [Alphaproteobacteria bacterium]|nr:nicotinate-nucleotide adenylyltransferase [Alphaproteobacteria bacterium]